jgi:hypothetical protein
LSMLEPASLSMSFLLQPTKNLPITERVASNKKFNVPRTPKLHHIYYIEYITKNGFVRESFIVRRNEKGALQTYKCMCSDWQRMSVIDTRRTDKIIRNAGNSVANCQERRHTVFEVWLQNRARGTESF